MATLLLQTAGAAAGAAFGGPFGAVLGRAAGAFAGNLIDQQIFGRDKVIQGPRLDQARILSSADGAAMPRIYGRVRIGGQIVWATRFEEVTSTRQSGGGKGAPSGPSVREYSYYANFAIGLCEGPVSAFLRIWADGVEIDRTRYDIRFYTGDNAQDVDPLIAAKQGEGNAPAFRGTACAVFEGFPLEEFGNRIPQFSFEVVRSISQLDRSLRAVCMIPAATEFGYHPEPVARIAEAGKSGFVNRNCLTHASDWQASLDELQALCPNLETIALVVPWFGTDLRAGECDIVPGVEHNASGGVNWSVSGIARSNARQVSRHEGSPAYGGTPSDSSVLAAIRDIRARGLKVVFYPFLLMDIASDNNLASPYGGSSQPAYPWRGEITATPASGQPSSADGTLLATSQVAAFCGSAQAGNFSVVGDNVTWTGGADQGYRRMVLHYAKLCTAAGGVDGFLIGSELRGLTTLRDENGNFPFVSQLMSLATDVRQICGPATKLTYAADWSEYFGHHPGDGSNDLLFHLDPLWAHPAIDAVGIDNYMPLTDWRVDGDPGAPDVFSQTTAEYLRSGIAGGEGYDWYYASDAERRQGIRSPITDGFGEPWVWRYKDILSWWENPHHERINGVRQSRPTAWVPQSKPVWFTEFGCPAIAMGANEPNVFPDEKSGSAGLPTFSTGGRNDLVQYLAILEQLRWWDNAESDLPSGRNPVSPIYGAAMLEPSNMFAWAWDARPFPAFPSATQLWSDGTNWQTGHWLNGRLGGCPVGELAQAIAADNGGEFETIECDGFVDGYASPGLVPARSALDPLMGLFNLSHAEDGEGMKLRSKAHGDAVAIDPDDLVGEDGEPVILRERQSEGELAREVELSHASVFNAYEPDLSRSRRLVGGAERIHSMDVPVVMPPSVATGVLDARLRDAWIGRETLTIGLPWSYLSLAVADQVFFTSRIEGIWQVDAIEDGAWRQLHLRRIARYDESASFASDINLRQATVPAFGQPVFHVMNLPLSPEDTTPHVHVALAAEPFARQYAVHASPGSSGFTLRASLTRNAVTGTLLAPLAAGPEGRFDNSNAITLRLLGGELASVPQSQLFNGANAAAIRNQFGEWEILQFTTADLQPDESWVLSKLLRAQLGTDAAMLGGHLVGAAFVLLNEAVTTVPMATLETGLHLNWRAGPAGDPVSADSHVGKSHTHAPVNLRPLSPVHVRAERQANGDVAIKWVRRSRIDADTWDNAIVPLGETDTNYTVEILRSNGDLVRSINVITEAAFYTSSEQQTDFGLLPSQLEIAVRQFSGSGLAGTARQLTASF
ncbi:MAG: glycoside hydrolase/phage tail family protein [Nitratireductor sp.]